METDDVKKLEFILRDENGDVIIHRTVTFPYLIDAWKIDAEIANIFLKIASEKEVN